VAVQLEHADARTGLGGVRAGEGTWRGNQHGGAAGRHRANPIERRGDRRGVAAL